MPSLGNLWRDAWSRGQKSSRRSEFTGAETTVRTGGSRKGELTEINASNF